MKKLFLLLTLTATLLFSASFDCKKATTDIEKLICSDEELSKLDDELGKAYKELLDKVNKNDKEIIRQQQRDWIRDRRHEDIIDVKYAYHHRIVDIRLYSDKLRDREKSIQENTIAQKTERYPTYAEVLEYKNVSFPKSTKQDLYSNVRPANNFILIGGTKKPLCKETLALFNEEGRYKLDDKEQNMPQHWYLNNSGLVEWVEFEQSSESDRNMVCPLFGDEYAEVDIDNDNVSEYIYRTSSMVRSISFQEVHAINQLFLKDAKLFKKYKQSCEKIYGQEKCNNNTALMGLVMLYANIHAEWKSTQSINEAFNRIVYDKKSIDILYPNNSLYLTRNLELQTNRMYFSLFKTKYGVVLVPHACYNDGERAPEYLVFSLRRDKLATLECIIMPKEWQE
ncbi:MAG: lysozyme inhibitor LprI family protein [Campylobacteraceae bacterium]|jgi:uncharacterized protein|nr:lysozyme inhibitor LprI family protein [Campylobacteraceae bacterium]